ncbi:MAG TPA: fibronectin type III domain-containing protein [Cyclobacteriaceae bacterium]
MKKKAPFEFSHLMSFMKLFMLQVKNHHLIIPLFFLLLPLKNVAQTTQTFNITNSTLSMNKGSNGLYNNSNELIAGNSWSPSTINRGYLEFDISSVPSTAIISSASVALKCWDYKGSNVGITKGTIALKKLSSKPSTLQTEEEWNLLGGTSRIANASVESNTSITISDAGFLNHVKASLSDNKVVFFSLIDTVDTYGFSFSNFSSDIILSITYTMPVPGVPTNLKAASITPNSFTLSWTASTGQVSGYYIYQNNVKLPGSVTTTSIPITGLQENTSYTYQVQAFNSAGPSAKSSPLTVTTPMRPPQSPTNLQASSITSTSAYISWTPPSGTVDNYKVYLGTNLVTTTANSFITLTGLLEGTSYTVFVVATNKGGDSPRASISFTTIPPAPTYLDATTTNTSATLSWICQGADRYEVYKDGVLCVSTTGVVTTIAGLTPNTNYSLTVKAFNTSGASALSSPLVIKTRPLAAPTDFAASGITSTSCNLSWTAPGGSVTGYRVYERHPTPALLKTIPAPATSTTINFTTKTNVNVLVIVAYNSDGESADSQVAPVVLLPSEPTGVTGTNITNTSLTLSWTASQGLVGGYRIYQNNVLIATTTALSINATNLTPGVTYTFTVFAYNQTGSSLSSSPYVYVPGTPSIPTNLAANNITSSNCRLSWSASTGTLSGYYVYRDGVKVATVTSTSSLVNLITGQEHSLQVSSYNAIGESQKSTALLVKALSQPTNLRVLTLTSTSVTLEWDPSSNVTGYNLYLFNSYKFATTPVTPYTISNLSPGSTYQFSVTSYTSNWESAKSNVVTFTMLPPGGRMETQDESVEVQKSGLVLSPQPMDNKLMVSGVEHGEIEILDIQGRSVYRDPLMPSQIDVSSLSPGMYIVRIKEGANIYVRRVVKN